MADISKLTQISSGLPRNVDLTTNTPVVLSVKIGGVTNTELTKTILDNLVALQNGSDFANGTNAHTHDGRYFTETEIGSTGATSGADLVGTNNTPTNYSPAAATVQDHLEAIDAALASAGGNEFSDSLFRIQDNGDATKEIAFEASGITTATTRTITMPDANVNLGDIATNATAISDHLTDTTDAHDASAISNVPAGNLAATDVQGALDELQSDVDGRATTSLNNLASTAVNADIIPDTTATRDLGSSSIGFQDVWAAQVIHPSGGGATGLGGFVGTALRTGSNNSGLQVVASGAVESGTSGEFVARSGNTSLTAGVSGPSTLRSGDHNAADASGTTGAVTLRSGNVLGGSSTGASGHVTVRSGTTVGGNSGSVFIYAGTTTTGTRGDVVITGRSLSFNIDGGTMDFNNTILSNLADPGLAQDAATKNYVDTEIANIPAASPEFSDATFRIQDNVDATKEIAFEASGITTGTVRTITMPDANVNLGDIANKANTELSNLGTTAIDADLLPDGAFSLGSISLPWTDVHANNGRFVNDVTVVAPDVVSTPQLKLEDSDLNHLQMTLQSSTESGLIDLSGSGTLEIQSSTGNLKLTPGSGLIDVSSAKIQSLANPTNDQDAATKIYVDNAIEGVKPKEAVRVATTVAGTLASDFEAGDTIDGVVLVAGDRILIKDQAAPEENGIYIVGSSGAPGRATDFDELTPINEIKGSYVAVEAGTENAGKLFVCNSDPAVLDTDPITFVYFNSITALSGGDGITLTGTTLSIDHDGEGLTFSAGQLALELDGSTLSKSSSGVKVADAGVTETQLATSVAGSGLTGGAGTALSVTSSPSIEMSMVAGESFAANTTFAVRIAVNGETAGRIYKADNDATSLNNFYVIGLVTTTGALTAGDATTVKLMGTRAQGSSDTAWASADLGKPVFLGASGALTVTAPTTTNLAVVRVGIVQTTTSVLVQPQVVGIN